LLAYYLAALAAPIATVWLFRQPIKKAIRNPAAFMLWSARITAAVDASILPIIMRQPLDEIEFVLLQVRAEKDSFERRMSLTTGAMEKIGVLPGLLAPSPSPGPNAGVDSR
jgi:hypothetical protein